MLEPPAPLPRSAQKATRDCPEQPRASQDSPEQSTAAQDNPYNPKAALISPKVVETLHHAVQKSCRTFLFYAVLGNAECCTGSPAEGISDSPPSNYVQPRRNWFYHGRTGMASHEFVLAESTLYCPGRTCIINADIALSVQTFVLSEPTETPGESPNDPPRTEEPNSLKINVLDN